MLFAEQGGRAQYGDLLAPGDSAEGSTQCDFRLAKADIAADQSVHGFAAAHVVDDSGNGSGLIGGFLETEALGEQCVVVFLEGEGMTCAGGAYGVEGKQLGGGVSCLFRCFALGFFPLAGTQRVQRRGIGIGAGVARNDVQLGNWHEQLGVAGVVQFEEFLLAQAQVHMHQAAITSDAVAFVHHRIAHFQFSEVFQPVVETGFALCVFAAASRAAGE